MTIYYEPWKGRNYGNNNKRLFILGESHYGDDKSDATIRYTKQYCEGKFSARFWTITMQIVSGKHNSELNRFEFWNNVAFYNFIQEPVGDDARVRPTIKMWEKAQQPFKQVLDKLKPTHMLVLGKELWENLPNEGKQGPLLKIPKCENRDTWIYPCKDGEVLATWVYHPSSGKGASYSLSYPYVKELLNIEL